MKIIVHLEKNLLEEFQSAIKSGEDHTLVQGRDWSYFEFKTKISIQLVLSEEEHQILIN